MIRSQSFRVILSTKWKKPIGWWVLFEDHISRYSFIQVSVYFSCSPLSWILCCGLVSTTKERWRFDRKRPSSCFQDVAAVINLTYEERIARIEIPSMKYCRMCGDMIMVYEILNGYDPSLEHLFAVDNNSITRLYNFKLKKPPFKTIMRQHFFNKHVVNNWNSLSFDVVNATPLTVLKISLINVAIIGYMSRESYKQTICFPPIAFFLSVFWATCVRSVCVPSGGISWADSGPCTHLGLSNLRW